MGNRIFPVLSDSNSFDQFEDKVLLIINTAVKWNFTKFLISCEGKEIKRFTLVTKPEKLERDIERTLG